MWSRFFTPKPTFEQIAGQWLAEKSRQFRPSWHREAQRLLAGDILPYLGEIRANKIRRADIARVVEQVAARGSFGCADHVLGVCRAIFRWSFSRGLLDADPTAGLRKRRAGKPRTRILSDDEIRSVWWLDCSPAIRDALRLQLTTACRIGEAMGARQAEFNPASALWVIPDERTKSRREHRLPLSPLAQNVVREALERAGSNSEWLFPSADPGRPIRVMSAIRVLGRRRWGFTSHDLRRTVASRLGEAGTPDAIIERVLNHQPTSVTRAHYDHSRRLGEMRTALDTWAQSLERIVS